LELHSVSFVENGSPQPNGVMGHHQQLLIA